MAEISVCVEGNVVTAYCDGDEAKEGTVGTQFSVQCGGQTVHITVVSSEVGGHVYYSFAQGNNPSEFVELDQDSTGLCTSLDT